MPRSIHGGRHELGQNFLNHRPTIDTVVALVAASKGTILELGAGDGALTRRLAVLGRPVTAIDLDEHRVRRLARALPGVDVRQADALRHRLAAGVVVGNVPFHLTTPILRRLLTQDGWRQAVLVTQWEVARKRAGVGGHTMLTAQTAPWFVFSLHGRVPARGFTPPPSVDGGILAIRRRLQPLVAAEDRHRYQGLVRAVFTGPGGGLSRVLARACGIGDQAARRILLRTGVSPAGLPRDLTAEQWAAVWSAVRDTRDRPGGRGA